MYTEVSATTGRDLHMAVFQTALKEAPSSINRGSTISVSRNSSAESYRGTRQVQTTEPRRLRRARNLYQSRAKASIGERIFSVASILVLLSISICVVAAFAKYCPSSPFEHYEIKIFNK